MSIVKKIMNVDTCIMMHDMKQIQKEPPQAKIKTKRKLSILLAKRKDLNSSQKAIYTQLYRAEIDGFKIEDKNLVNAVLKTLEVTREELITEKPDLS